MSRPMNDDEVLSEMKKMVAFIKQEAMEKAREIQVKADEEFAIEKVRTERGEEAGSSGAGMPLVDGRCLLPSAHPLIVLD